MKHTRDMEELVERSYIDNLHVPTDAGMDERILDDAVAKMEESRKTGSASAGPNIWRIIMKSKMTKLTTAAVAALVIIIGIIDFGEPVGGASAAFAAAMDSVRQARTFSCTTIFEVTYEHGGKRGEYLLKQRRMFKEPDWERHEQQTSAPPWPQDVGKVTIWHYGKRQRLEFSPFDKTAEFHDTSSDYAIDAETGELKLIQLNTRLRDHLLKLSAGAVEDLGTVELDRQSVRLLRSRKDKRITTVWVNPETSYPVQIEHKWTDQSRSPVMFASIQIDAELDDELFSLEPPQGYTLSVEESGWPNDKAKMMTKIKYLGLWCVIYANDNDDQFPDDLGDLVRLGVITEEVLNRVAASPDDPSGPPVFRCRKRNTDTKDWATEIILYEIYDQWPEDGIVTCFADGHCELIADQNRFEELIK